MASENGVYVFPDTMKQAASSVDPNLMLAMQNGGGFGGNNWIWILFIWILMGRNGFGVQGGAGYLANQMSNEAGRDLLLQAINGRADAAAQLAQITNTSVQAVQSALNTIQSSIQSVGQQVGMSGLQVQNAVQSGNAALAQQICQCCCENRLAVANQTNALQANMASNHAASTLQAAQDAAASQLAVERQTNQLGSQADRNSQSVLNAIAGQTTMITKEFCDLKDREYQAKIDSLTANNALLRSEIDNNRQTQSLAAMLAPIQAQVQGILGKLPQTVTLPFSQYSVVPSWYAQAGTDFVASYWANRLSQATANSGTAGATKVNS